MASTQRRLVRYGSRNGDQNGFQNPGQINQARVERDVGVRDAEVLYMIFDTTAAVALGTPMAIGGEGTQKRRMPGRGAGLVHEEKRRGT